jgi:3-hydroxybutyryl-CoA dehydrogenase
MKVGVVGTAAVGQGIAEMLAAHGLDVNMYERYVEQTDKVMEDIAQHLDAQIEKWAITLAEKKLILSRIHIIEDLTALGECEFVIDTIEDNLNSKKFLFAQLDESVGSNVILASNTATLSLTEIAGATRHPDRVIGMHFVYPVEKSGLVEIVRALKTSEQTFKRTKTFIENVIEKQSVMVYESPGFVTTRLFSLMVNEALHVLEEGVASVEDIDTAMRIGYEFHKGPFEMADELGLDVLVESLERMFKEYGELKYRPSFILKKMVRARQLGKKTGVGFFHYDADGHKLTDGTAQ